MGYPSLLEDITSKFFEVQSLIKSEAETKGKRIINGPIQSSKTDRHDIQIKKEKPVSVFELEELKRKNKNLVREVAMLRSEINQRRISLINYKTKLKVYWKNIEELSWQWKMSIKIQLEK